MFVKLLLKAKDINRKSGKGAASCPFYEEIDKILGTRAASTLVLLDESTGDGELVESREVHAGMFSH